jgi:hypothetical protein
MIDRVWTATTSKLKFPGHLATETTMLAQTR